MEIYRDANKQKLPNPAQNQEAANVALRDRRLLPCEEGAAAHRFSHSSPLAAARNRARRGRRQRTAELHTGAARLRAAAAEKNRRLPAELTVKRCRASGRLKSSGGDIAPAERRSATRADDAIAPSRPRGTPFPSRLRGRAAGGAPPQEGASLRAPLERHAAEGLREGRCRRGSEGGRGRAGQARRSWLRACVAL